MRARLIEIAGGLFLGLALLAASVGATVIMGRFIGERAGTDASSPINEEVAR
jgi:F0F1-type ATP synthase membrane subunit c/vacuolar-type H+-ATPase subunit K